MNKQKIIFTHQEGIVEGIYINSGDHSPLVIIVNGHNGFYNYGMFPYIQQKLFENNISSYSFNYSHGGVIGDSDRFDDLYKYEQNCMRLEVEDVISILLNSKNSSLAHHAGIYLFAHSLGGVPAIFATAKAMYNNIAISGIILVSSVSTLNFWPAEMIKEWSNAGVYFKKNNRTLQELPQGFEFLQEVTKSESEWNVKNKIQTLQIPVLIIHGDNDEAVPKTHGESLFSWIKQNNIKSEFISIPSATHTFNTKHPFEKSSPQLEQLLKTTIDWINKIQ